MPGSGSRGLTKERSQQQSMEGTAAEAARGSGSSSQVPHSPPQNRGSTDTEVEDCCVICLGSCEEPSFVVPCLHCFCYSCILEWANNKTQCPLCKRGMTSILHSVRADDDFEEHVIIPTMTPAVILPASRAHREPDAPNPPRPGAHQQWGTGGDVQDFVGGFQLPNWMSCFSACSAIQQTLHSWFCQSLEMLFETETPRAQHARGPEQQHRREDHHLPRQWDSHGATGQEDSSSLTPSPARSRVDEMPSTSSSATGGGPSTHPSASTTTHVEQQGSQEEPERLCPRSPESIRGSDPSPEGPRRPRKRRASSPKVSPALRRPRHWD